MKTMSEAELLGQSIWKKYEGALLYIVNLNLEWAGNGGIYTDVVWCQSHMVSHNCHPDWRQYPSFTPTFRLFPPNPDTQWDILAVAYVPE